MLPLSFKDLSHLAKLLVTLVKKDVDWFLRQLIEMGEERRPQILRGQFMVLMRAAKRFRNNLIDQIEFLQVYSCQLERFRRLRRMTTVSPENGCATFRGEQMGTGQILGFLAKGLPHYRPKRSYPPRTVAHLDLSDLSQSSP